MKKLIVAITALSLSLLLLSGCAVTPPAATPTPAASAAPTAEPEESAAPAASEAERTSFGKFTTTDLNGNEVTEAMFADYDLTMINIWATFCGPCINEMPHLGELAAEYKEKGVQIVASSLTSWIKRARYLPPRWTSPRKSCSRQARITRICCHPTI